MISTDEVRVHNKNRTDDEDEPTMMISTDGVLGHGV